MGVTTILTEGDLAKVASRLFALALDFMLMEAV